LAFFLKPLGCSCSSTPHAPLHDQPSQLPWGSISQSHRGCIAVPSGLYRSPIGAVIAVPSQSHRGCQSSPIGSPIGVCIGVCIGTAISAVPPPSEASAVRYLTGTGTSKRDRAGAEGVGETCM
jgi:hypothetical protein